MYVTYISIKQNECSVRNRLVWKAFALQVYFEIAANVTLAHFDSWNN